MLAVLKKTVAMCIIQASLAMPLAAAAPQTAFDESLPSEVVAQIQAMIQQGNNAEAAKDGNPDNTKSEEEELKEKVAENLATYRVIEKSRFMIAAKEADLDKIAPLHEPDIPVVTKMDFGALFDFASAEKKAEAMNGGLLPLGASKDAKMTQAEKRAETYDLYKEVITQLNTELEANEKTRFDKPAQELASLNRYIISSPMAINQYAETTDEGISGTAYKLFVAANTEQDYLVQAERYIREYVASPNHSAAQKLAVLRALKEADVVKDAKEASDKKLKEWEGGNYSTAKLDKEAASEFSDMEGKEEVGKAYVSFVKEANKAIVQREYDGMPERITRAQYAALSDIDKMKYKPEEHEKYKSKDHYVKLGLSEIVMQKFPKNRRDN